MERNLHLDVRQVAIAIKDSPDHHGKGYKLVIGTKESLPTREHAVVYNLFKLLNTERIQIYRKRFLYDSIVDSSIVLSEFTYDGTTMVNSVDAVDKKQYADVTRGSKKSINANAKEHYFNLDENCTIVLYFKSKIVIDLQAKLFLDFYLSQHFYSSIYKSLNNVDNIISSIVDDSRSRTCDYASLLFDSLRQVRPRKYQTDFEKWIYLERDASSLDTILFPIHQSNSAIHSCCLLEKIEKCNECTFNKEIFQDNPSFDINSPDSCVVQYPKLRLLLSHCHENKQSPRDKYDNVKLKINALIKPHTLNLPWFIKKIANQISQKKINQGKSYDELNEKLVAWAVTHCSENEYFRTVLFTISSISIYAEGRACNCDLKEISELWAKIVEELSTYITKYLKLWNIAEEPDRGKVIMTPDWLLGWFSIENLKSLAFEKYSFEKQQFSPEETLLYHRHLANLCLYVLFWIRKFGDTHGHTFSDNRLGYQSALNAVIYLICEYTYIDGGLTREASLYRTLLYMWSHQSILYTLRDSYRDHLHHVIELCIMGLCLIKSSSTYKDGQENKLPWLPQDNERTIRNWIVAAMFHDVGYGVQIIRSPFDHLAFYEADVVVKYRKKVKEKLNKYEKLFGAKSCQELRNKFPGIRIPDKDLEEFDHGVISALNIAALIDSRRNEWLLDMAPAVEASAMHNCKHSKIDQANMPLSFLLFLCDHLQEWDRPYIEGEQMRYSLLVDFVRMNRHTRSHGVSFVNYLECYGFEMGDHGKLQIMSNHPCFNIEFSPIHGEGYYPPLAWVGHGNDFQKISNCPFPVTVRLRHPVKVSQGKIGSHFEMDLFQHFLRESGKSAPGTLSKDSGKMEVGNSVLREWAAKARQKDAWFVYNNNEKMDDSDLIVEEMEYKLHEVDNIVHIPALPPRLVKHFIAWRKRYRAGLYEPAGLNSF